VRAEGGHIRGVFGLGKGLQLKSGYLRKAPRQALRLAAVYRVQEPRPA
jgi:hypothetical protein